MTKWSHTQFLWCRPPMNKRCSLTLTLPALCLPTMPSAFVFRVGEFLKRCVPPDQTLYWSRCPGHLIKQSVWPANAPFRIQLMAVVFFFLHRVWQQRNYCFLSSSKYQNTISENIYAIEWRTSVREGKGKKVKEWKRREDPYQLVSQVFHKLTKEGEALILLSAPSTKAESQKEASSKLEWGWIRIQSSASS